jgi:hypothetical protein
MGRRVNWIRHSIACLAAVTAIVATSAVPAGAAPAAPAGGETAALSKLAVSPGKAQVVSFRAPKDVAGTQAAYQPSVIYCFITARNPYWFPSTSSIPFDTVNAEVNVWCTWPVARIAALAAAAWFGVVEGQQIGGSNVTASYSLGAMAACVDGPWNTIGATIIYAPPGYTPLYLELSATSGTVYMDCAVDWP